MADKICDEGEYRWLNILLGTQVVDGVLYLGLYKDVTEFADDVVLTDFTEPPGFGYERKVLTRGSWVIDITAGEASASYAEHIFYADGGDWGDVYGYFIATSLDNSGKSIAVGHFANFFQIEDGKGIRVTPVVKFD